MLSYDRKSQVLAMGLAALAGFVDALGFLSLGGVFVSFMSGNSTRLGVGIAGKGGLVAMIPLVVITLFVAGVMLGRLVRHYAPKNPSLFVLAFMSVLLLVAAIAGTVGIPAIAVSFMALSMGAANNVFIREGEVAIGVTYMTGTLVKLGQRLAGIWLGEADRRWLPYFLLWLSLVVGASLGAVCFARLQLASLWIAALFCAVQTCVFGGEGPSREATSSPE